MKCERESPQGFQFQWEDRGYWDILLLIFFKPQILKSVVVVALTYLAALPRSEVIPGKIYDRHV